MFEDQPMPKHMPHEGVGGATGVSDLAAAIVAEPHYALGDGPHMGASSGLGGRTSSAAPEMGAVTQDMAVPDVHIVPDAICYLRGTRILTPTGQVPVERLRIGDRVVTRFGAVRPVSWIGQQSYDTRFLRKHAAKMPVRISAGALGEGLPSRDLYVSPGHSMLLDGGLVLAAALVNGITITHASSLKSRPRIEYFQIDLGTHDCVIAEGTWSETFADGPGLRDAFHNVQEFHALYPDHPPAEELVLCAPRPDHGPRLEALLRPVVERAAVGIKPGPLQGYIDSAGAWKVEGWAHDPAHPQLPVLLEVLVHGEVIGTVLACDHRSDLEEAGKGRGRCAFAFTPPVRLSRESLATLTMRRSVDGAMLPLSEDCLTALGGKPAAIGLRAVA